VASRLVMMYETDDKTARQIDLKLKKAVGDSAGVPKEWVGIESVEISNSSTSSDASGGGAEGGEGEEEGADDGDGDGEGERRLESEGFVRVGFTISVPYPAALPKIPSGATPLPADLNKLAGGEEDEVDGPVVGEAEGGAGKLDGSDGAGTDSNLTLILVGVGVVVVGFAGICIFISTKKQRPQDSGMMNQVCNNESEGTNEWLSEMIGAANSEFSFSEAPELQAERV